MLRAELKVTHEFVIEGEKCWVNFGLAYDVDQDVTDTDLDRTVDELSAAVNDQLFRIIEQVTEKKMAYEPPRRSRGRN